MMKIILLILLFVTAILLPNTQAQVYNVDPDIQGVYEYYHGVSLEQAINNLDKTKSSLDSNIVKEKPDSSRKFRRPCYALGLDPSIIPVTPRKSLTKKDYSDFPATRRFIDGKRVLKIQIIFEGDDEDLKALGVRINLFKYNENTISVNFPLEILPEICKVNGVKYIYDSGGYKIQLNKSSEDIEGHYTTIQQNHGSGY